MEMKVNTKYHTQNKNKKYDNVNKWIHDKIYIRVFENYGCFVQVMNVLKFTIYLPLIYSPNKYTQKIDLKQLFKHLKLKILIIDIFLV